MTIDTQTLLQHITDHPGQTKIELAENFSVTPFEIAKPIADLIDAGAVVRKVIRQRGQAYYAAGPKEVA